MRFARHALLALHLLANAAWFGGLLATLGLLRLGDAASATAAFRIHDALVWCALVVVWTATLFALFFPWGFFTFRWVTAKWAALVVAGGLVFFVGVPAHADVAAGLVDAVARARAVDAAVLVVLALATALSVVKPWGKGTLAARLPEVPRRAVAAGTLGALVVTSGVAVAQSFALDSVRALRFPPRAAPFADGDHTGACDVGGGGRVVVHVADGHIGAIDVVAAPSDNRYAAHARGVLARVVAAQRTDVDAVSGATTTSRVFLCAVDDALHARSAGAGR